METILKVLQAIVLVTTIAKTVLEIVRGVTAMRREHRHRNG